MATKAQVRKVVEDYFAAICAKDVEAWLAVFAADGVSHDPYGMPPWDNVEKLRQVFANFSMFNNIEITKDNQYVNGNQAAVKWTLRAEFAQGGNKVSMEGIDLFEVNDDGKLQTLKAYYNPNDLKMLS